MQDFLTYGFLIPPRGEQLDLTDYYCNGGTHFDYCRKYIETKLTKQQKEAYEVFKYHNWSPSSVRKNNPYTDFCVQVLGWCKVGNIFPGKVITFTGQARWHDEIYKEYTSYGFRFDFIPEIKLSTLINPEH